MSGLQSSPFKLSCPLDMITNPHTSHVFHNAFNNTLPHLAPSSPRHQRQEIPPSRHYLSYKRVSHTLCRFLLMLTFVSPSSMHLPCSFPNSFIPCITRHICAGSTL